MHETKRQLQIIRMLSSLPNLNMTLLCILNMGIYTAHTDYLFTIST